MDTEYTVEASYDQCRGAGSLRNLIADSLMIYYLVLTAAVLEKIYGKS